MTIAIPYDIEPVIDTSICECSHLADAHRLIDNVMMCTLTCDCNEWRPL